MTSVTDTLCPSCFREGVVKGRCPHCGFSQLEHPADPRFLPWFSILNARYLVGKSLGQGGFGITYLAKDMLTGSICCIKEYYPNNLISGRTSRGDICLGADADREEFEQGKRQFIEEARALQELRGNITVVDIRGFFEENSTAYFVMEYLDGCNLRGFQREHTPEQNYRMSLQMLFLVGSALAEVHRFGLLHGDISPENILITTSGDIKLIDFGAASSFRHRGTGGKKIYLKPNYAPYEQYTLKPYQGPWTDLYALAATFYFIVSGQKMIDAPSRAKGAQYTPLWQLSPCVSRELSEVIDRALAFDYHDRYRSLLEFMADLEKVTRPEEFNIDLRALMPQPAPVQPAPVQQPVQQSVQQPVQQPVKPVHYAPQPPQPEEEKEQQCAVEEQSMPEHKGLGGLFHRKKQMAYLDLAIYGENIISRRRWLIEPNRTVRIGRLANSDVMMPADNLISRTHCELYYNEKRKEFVLRDLSKFGTLLEDKKPMEKNRPYTLKDNAVFYVLSPKYKFRLVIEK